MNRIALCSAVAVALFAATPAHAISDHLQCYKIKDDAAKVKYTADLTPSDVAFAASTGCTVQVPAKLLCVDTTKSNVSPAPPGAADGTAAQKYLCYKTKCPPDVPTASFTDQFGTHGVTVKGTGLLCAPIPAALPTCSDATQNGAETDVDCGGGTCPDCDTGEGCVADSDCLSSVCSGGQCQAPSCSDAVQNGNETDTDCGGGTCPACIQGMACSLASDCQSQVCTAGVCQAPSCSDGIQNGGETGTDCSGGCPACGTGQGCASGSDCQSFVCVFGFCQAASCSDGVQNGSETDTDCGGGTCPTCANGNGCVSASDCTSNSCVLGTCQAAPNGSACSIGSQCASGSCVDGYCCNSACAGLCQRCSIPGGIGTCSFIPIGTDPDNECSGVQNCNGTGACF